MLLLDLKLYESDSILVFLDLSLLVILGLRSVLSSATWELVASGDSSVAIFIVLLLVLLLLGEEGGVDGVALMK